MASATCCFRCRAGGANCLIAYAADWKEDFCADRLAAAVKSLGGSIVKGRPILFSAGSFGCAFAFDLEANLANLRARAPRWRDEYGGSAAR